MEFLICMTCLHVCDEVALVSTSVRAIWANERLLSCVFTKVNDKLGFTDGLISTDPAPILPSIALLAQLHYGPPNRERSWGRWENHRRYSGPLQPFMLLVTGCIRQLHSLEEKRKIYVTPFVLFCCSKKGMMPEVPIISELPQDMLLHTHFCGFMQSYSVHFLWFCNLLFMP